MLAMNQALMLKHLWRILQNDGTSIWVDWIQHYRLRNSTIWTFNGATGSWSWKKLIKLRPLLQNGVCYKVGNGSSFSLWQDIWHARGPLCLSYPRGPALTGLPISSLLSSVLQQDQWRWPASTEADIAEIISQLPPTNPTTSDQICWRNSAGKFTVQSAILLIQPATMQVQWHGLLRDVWTADAKGGSWGWRKLLRLRSALLPYIEFKVGNGDIFSIWHDPWHSLGSLIRRFPRGPSRTNIPIAAKLCGDCGRRLELASYHRYGVH
ncbi:UNVERIFIED_CONTAM: hypothetical protein Scaly_2906700 [Sesamum calycinum]|uniref:Reverse transcriptase zinc-binding domain-containing protein n=1 Tax=Sesamum calycinum TaxID=2727403 RepID=A0AAW2L345_9LAMI